MPLKFSRKKRFYLLFFICIVSMFIIFMFSHMPYEEQDIKPFLRDKIDLTNVPFPSITFEYDGQIISSDSDPYGFIEFLFRKAGHVIGYCLLTLLLFLTLMQTKIKRPWVYLLSGALSIAYALTDEWHQSFVPGRTGHWQDAIIIDGTGVILGLVIGFIGTIFFKKRKTKGRF
ncbi:VanZ family protein [Niallia circulans]|nr:VanZ family protein [Niallia circulans]MCM2981857.1 VanZ family protein [Niallia circulans]MED3838417.1 VanZ family protein [Niallia circulans]MED4243891.1 VanZ family protein [Niallia circulans]MED4246284.1 VanZ family protein [Niallia circulans]MED5100724.1 VanZ family protein [Niallia circulans]